MADRNGFPTMGITVIRYADGQVELRAATALDMPVSWQARHDLLIAALEQVKREAGVVHTGAEP